MAKPRIKVPASAKAGEVIEIKTLVSHSMETGQRKGSDGKKIPRNIINTMSATFDGKPVFEAKMQPGISANPYVSFFMKATKSGEIKFTWTEDNGKTMTETRKITVS